MKKEPYHICEYGVIRCLDDYKNIDVLNNTDELYLRKESFDSIYKYCLAQQEDSIQGDKPFGIIIKNGKRQIRIKNYVGLLETKEGVQLEILPKIYLDSSQDTLKETRTIFLKMLKHLKDSPFINLNAAHLNSKQNFPILEVFISAYIAEAEKLFNYGIKSDYLIKEENLSTIKGKIKVSQNIKLNYADKAKVYCEFPEYSRNIPNNRIVKSTVLKLLKATSSYKNYFGLNKLLTHMSEVESSNNIKADLQKINYTNRLFSNYKVILKWSEVFLTEKGFTNFVGNNLNLSILFPMERIFEDYISFLFNKYSLGYKIKLQDSSYFLVEKHKGFTKFGLRPDLVASKEDEVFILDTKWKLIDQNAERKNYNITQADMYQLYAYGKKYHKDKEPNLVLLYPANKNFTNELSEFIYEGDLKLRVVPFDFNKKDVDQIQEIFKTAIYN